MGAIMTEKYQIVLIDYRYKAKEPMDMGEQEFESWSEVEKLAAHWCTKHDYPTWTLGQKVIKKKPVRPKKSKKS
jgi:hypothetical protein